MKNTDFELMQPFECSPLDCIEKLYMCRSK